MGEERTARIGRRLGSAVTALAIAGAGVLASRTAQAGVGIAADVEADMPVDSEADTALGVTGRLGYRLHLPLFILIPEIGLHYASFDSNPTLLRGIVGARMGFGEVVRFGGYAHVGVGSLSFDNGADDVSGFTFDAGAFLDFTLLPYLNMGVHAGYGIVDVEDSDSLRWVPLGIHVELVL
jgi:hypothetical protein